MIGTKVEKIYMNIIDTTVAVLSVIEAYSIVVLLLHRESNEKIQKNGFE